MCYFERQSVLHSAFHSGCVLQIAFRSFIVSVLGVVEFQEAKPPEE